jgi:hypothetical protein
VALVVNNDMRWPADGVMVGNNFTVRQKIEYLRSLRMAPGSRHKLEPR